MPGLRKQRWGGREGVLRRGVVVGVDVDAGVAVLVRSRGGTRARNRDGRSAVAPPHRVEAATGGCGGRAPYGCCEKGRFFKPEVKWGNRKVQPGRRRGGGETARHQRRGRKQRRGPEGGAAAGGRKGYCVVRVGMPLGNNGPSSVCLCSGLGLKGLDTRVRRVGYLCRTFWQGVRWSRVLVWEDGGGWETPERKKW